MDEGLWDLWWMGGMCGGGNMGLVVDGWDVWMKEYGTCGGWVGHVDEGIWDL